MAELQLKNLTKVFDKDVVAVDNFNLDIHDKDFLVLVGPSGCGKSTTLRMVAGLEEITDGELYIDDVYMNDVAPKDRKSTRLNSSHVAISYAVFCLKKKNNKK